MPESSRPRVWGAFVAGAALLAGASAATAANPVLNSPGAGAFTDTSTPGFTWSDPTPLPDTELDHYEVRVDGSPAPGGGNLPPGTTSFTPTSGIAEGARAWEVVRVNNTLPEESSGQRTLNVDLTDPTISWTRSPVVPNGANGWYVSNVGVTPNCSDPLAGSPAVASGVASCTVNGGQSQGTHTGSSKFGQSFDDGAASDNAGNSIANQSSTLTFLDKTRPIVQSWNISGTAGANGWYTSPVTFTPVCFDQFSGVATCTGGGTKFDNGIGQGFTNGSATDIAGWGIETLASSPTVNIDQDPPEDAALQTPSPGAVTNDSTPKLVWDETDDVGPSLLDHYEVVIDGGTPIVVAPSPTPDYTPSSPLANGGHSWRVDTVDVAGNTNTGAPRVFTVDPNAVGGPTITGGPPNPTNQTSPTFTWSGLPGTTEYKWEFRKGSQIVDFGTEGAGTTSTTVSTAGDGNYTFVITQKTTGVHGTETAYVFRLDTVAPAQPVLVGLPPDSSTDATPTFSWVGEPLGLYRWQILSGGAVVQQGDSLANQITPQPLAPGSYVFRVRQTDDAGNVGPFSPEDGFGIVAPAPPTSPAPPATTTKTTTKTTTTATPQVANTRRLKPKVGSKLTTKRPTLRWTRRAGATVYNIQIFELNGRNFKKVLSRFPVRNTFRVPAGKLKYGKRYVWRVWPFLGSARAAASNPVGVSYFDLRRPKLNAVLAKRLITPRASRFAKAKKITARWKNRRGSRFYRVELRRGKKVVYRSTTRRRRAIIPAKRVRSKGKYTLVVRASRGSARNKFHRVTWARGTFRRT